MSRPVTELQPRHLAVLSGLQLPGIDVFLLGFDTQGDPVVQVHDAHGLGEAWAIRKTDSEQRLFPPTLGTVSDFTDEEVELFNPAHFDYLCARFPYNGRKAQRPRRSR